MPTTDLPALVCRSCGRRVSPSELAWRCDCGGLFDADFAPRLNLADLAEAYGTPASSSLWRYRSVLPVAFDPAVSMGEGLTALLSSRLSNVLLKADFMMPTLSFKDRGAVVLATLAARLRADSASPQAPGRPTRALVDSSGNAGTAAAAYFARAGIPIRVLVPRGTSAGKLAQSRAHGADVVVVPGDRSATSAAALAEADTPGTFYASHVYHPYFVHGVKTYGYEVWEQLGRRAPDVVVVPVGNGTLVLGCHLAFTELLAAGLIDRLPAIVAVQADACAPLAAAFEADSDDIAPLDPQPTKAEGIAIAAPPRAEQILAAVRGSGGGFVRITDAQVETARADLAAQGLYVEPTSAVCWAAVRAAMASGDGVGRHERDLLTRPTVVVPLCGAGLKSPY